MEKLSDEELVSKICDAISCLYSDEVKTAILSRLNKGRKAILAMEKIDSATDAMEDTYKDRILIIKSILADCEKEIKDEPRPA